MSDETTPFTGGPRSGHYTIAHASAASLICAQALAKTLIELGPANGDNPAEWLDSLEKSLLRDAKGTRIEGIPIEQEADALQYGVDMLEGALKYARRKLTKDNPSQG